MEEPYQRLPNGVRVREGRKEEVRIGEEKSHVLSNPPKETSL